MNLFTAILFCGSLLISTIDGKIQVGLFKSRTCSLADIKIFSVTELSLSSIRTSSSSSSMTCAFSCNRNSGCDQALYNISAKICKQREILIESESIDTGDDGYDHDDDIDDFEGSGKIGQAIRDTHTLHNLEECVVLTKQNKRSQLLSRTPAPMETETTMIPHNLFYDPAFLFPTVMVTTEDDKNGNETFIVRQASRVSYAVFTSPKQVFVLTTNPRILALNSTDGKFAEPLKQDVKILISSSPIDLITFTTNLFGNLTLKRTTTPDDIVLVDSKYTKDLAHFQDIVFADSVTKVRDALLDGYRRVENNPTRSVIDSLDGDVYFDMTETLYIDDEKDVKAPLYVTTFKDGVKNKKRHIFRYSFNNGLKVEHENKDYELPWTMETTWQKIDMSRDLWDELKAYILQGKEVRIVLEKQISTDIISAEITSNEVIADLAQYMYPFKGSDAVGYSPFVRFPVVTTSRKIMECGVQFQSSFVHETTSIKYTSIQWFVSTKNWTKVYVLNAESGLTNGSLVDLETAVVEGRNVRVCVHHNSSSIICHGAISIQTTVNNDVILQSPPFLQKGVRDKTLVAIEPSCQRVQRLVSTEGWVQTATYSIGQSASFNTRSVPFEKQEWFVER